MESGGSWRAGPGRRRRRGRLAGLIAVIGLAALTAAAAAPAEPDPAVTVEELRVNVDLDPALFHVPPEP